MKAQVGTITRIEPVEFAPGTMRPSGAFMSLWEALIREIALGLNLPYGFVYDMARFNGVTARPGDSGGSAGIVQTFLSIFFSAPTGARADADYFQE